MESGDNHQFSLEILRQYDIRGIVGKNITPKDAMLLGNIIAQHYNDSDDKFVVIGYDGRNSSPELMASLCSGFTNAGIAVWNCGLISTPELYFAAHISHAPFGIMITGSHNPKEYNGFKIVRHGKPFWGKEIAQFSTMNFQKYSGATANIIHKNYRLEYMQALRNASNLTKDLKIVWDLGNGAICPTFNEFIKDLRGQHILLYNEVDGNFPNHHPDPTVEANLSDLKAAVIKNQADFGVAFDGDGDRIGVVDGKAIALWGDQLLSLYAKPILAKNHGATIIADVKASQLFFEEVKRLGGNALMAPTGHSIIKTKMRETGALLAGEMSGHIFFNDRWFGFDDALYAALRLMEICNGDENLEELRLALPQYYNTPEIRIDIDESVKFQIMTKISEYLTNIGKKYDNCDGVRVQEVNGWWLVRASNTQNCLVLRAEATSPEFLAQYEAKAREIIQKFS